MRHFRKVCTKVFLVGLLLGASVFCRAELSSFADEISKMSPGGQELFVYDSFSGAEGMFLFASPVLKDETKYKLMLVTSAANNCIGCVCSAVIKLKEMKFSENEIVGLQSGEGIHSLKISEKDKALFVAARELTLHPDKSVASLELAKKAGWTEDELASAITIVSHFNSRNRLRIGFNIGPDKSHPYKPDQKLPMASCP